MKSIIKYIIFLIVSSVLLFPEILYSQDLPLIYNQGTSYVGPYEPSEPITISGNTEPVVIEGKEFSGLSDHAIQLWRGTDIIIRNCKFTNISSKHAIYSEKGTNVTITNCVFENVAGAFLAQLAISDVKFEHNDIMNITSGYGIFFQNCEAPGLTIRNNAIENFPGQSEASRVIGTNGSRGTSDSPFLISNNWIRGGTFIGIAIGQELGAYQVIEDNRLVNPGQYGVYFMGGNNITFRNNKFYGEPLPGSVVGMNFDAGNAQNITVENNQINWTNESGSFVSASFNENMKGQLPNWEEINVRVPKIDESILPEVILGIIEPFDPNPPQVETPKMNVYADSFNRVSIKIFKNPTPEAIAEIFDSTGDKVAEVELSAFRTLVDKLLSPGEYEVKVTFSALEVSESNTIIIN